MSKVILGEPVKKLNEIMNRFHLNSPDLRLLVAMSSASEPA